MNASSPGICGWEIDKTPIAVIDFETTGLTPGADRVVEVSVIRLEPGEEPRLVLDTLVNPRRPVAATEIHGITDEDVASAPIFPEIAGDLVRALSGCVVAAYNVYFDIRFLKAELRDAQIDALPPHLCVMYMRPMLGLGCRCTLDQACEENGLGIAQAHMAACDAMAAAELMRTYRHHALGMGLRTFGDLAELKDYKFVRSFELPPFSPELVKGLVVSSTLEPRSLSVSGAPGGLVGIALPRPPVEKAMREYWEALKVVLADLVVSDDELKSLNRKRRLLGLSENRVRVLHARAFKSVISRVVDDGVLDDDECRLLERLHNCLGRLGWAPGEPPDSGVPRRK